MTAAWRLGWLLVGFAAATLAEAALHAGSAWAQETYGETRRDSGQPGLRGTDTSKDRASAGRDTTDSRTPREPASELGPYDTPARRPTRIVSDAAAEDADANPDDTLNAPERDGDQEATAPGAPREPGDGDLSTPAEDEPPTDGTIDLADPQPPEDGGDPNRDTRPPEDVEVFENPPAGFDPLLFQIEDIYPAVTDRRPERLFRLEPYDPIGIRIGSFVLFPEVEINGLATNNVLDSPSPNSDVAAEIRTNTRFVSNWSRHAVELRGTSLTSFYDDFPSEDDRAWGVEARGRLDMTHRTNLQGLASHDFSQESRTAVDANTVGPRANVTTDRAELALNHRFNRLAVQLRGSVVDSRYSDTDDVSNADRDVLETQQAVRATWEFKPTLGVFAEEEINQREKDAAPADGIPRNSEGTRTRVGLDFGATGAILRGTISVGYGRQVPDDARLKPVDTVLFDANLAWRPSAITSFLLVARTDIYDTTTTDSGGVAAHQIGIEARHALRRHLIASAGLAYTDYDYDNVTLKENQLLSFAMAEYYASPELVLFARYQHLAFESNQANSDYDTDEVRVGVRVRR